MEGQSRAKFYLLREEIPGRYLRLGTASDREELRGKIFEIVEDGIDADDIIVMSPDEYIILETDGSISFSDEDE